MLTITQLLITASAVFICGKVSRKGKLFPTQSSRSRLDKLPIEVGDDCIALLCCVHPDGGEDETTTKTHHQVTQRSSKVQSSLTQWCWHDWNNSDSHFCDHLHSVGFIANNRHRYVKWNRRQYRVICPVIDDCFGFCTVTPDSGGTDNTNTACMLRVCCYWQQCYAKACLTQTMSQNWLYLISLRAEHRLVCSTLQYNGTSSELLYYTISKANGNSN